MIISCDSPSGGGKDSQWVMQDGKLICLDCYKKIEASKEKLKQAHVYTNLEDTGASVGCVHLTV